MQNALLRILLVAVLAALAAPEGVATQSPLDAPDFSAADFLSPTRLWTAHFTFTAEQWTAMQPHYGGGGGGFCGPGFCGAGRGAGRCGWLCCGAGAELAAELLAEVDELGEVVPLIGVPPFIGMASLPGFSATNGGGLSGSKAPLPSASQRPPGSGTCQRLARSAEMNWSIRGSSAVLTFSW